MHQALSASRLSGIWVVENKLNMRVALVTLVACFVALTHFYGVQCEKKKLQIGVKKKVENCSRRSRKGDVLHMHYTVSIGPCFTLKSVSLL